MLKYFNRCLVLIILTYFVGCSYAPDIHDLEYYGRLNISDPQKTIRTDGFFYRNTDSVSTLLMFFEDGTYYRSSLWPVYDVWINHKKPICELPGSAKHCLSCWGAYIIEKDTIKMQKFSNEYAASSMYINERWAVIENDSTLHFIKYIFYHKKTYISDLDYRLDFKQCASRSDSMNILFQIENK